MVLEARVGESLYSEARVVAQLASLARRGQKADMRVRLGESVERIVLDQAPDLCLRTTYFREAEVLDELLKESSGLTRAELLREKLRVAKLAGEVGQRDIDVVARKERPDLIGDTAKAFKDVIKTARALIDLVPNRERQGLRVEIHDAYVGAAETDRKIPALGQTGDWYVKAATFSWGISNVNNGKDLEQFWLQKAFHDSYCAGEAQLGAKQMELAAESFFISASLGQRVGALSRTFDEKSAWSILVKEANIRAGRVFEELGNKDKARESFDYAEMIP